jgi:hypothetical protein
MDTKGIKIALTIAVGILIGWLIGHTISNVFTYRIAVTIIGAIAGYFIWEPMKVWQAGRNIILGTTWVVWEIIAYVGPILLCIAFIFFWFHTLRSISFLISGQFEIFYENFIFSINNIRGGANAISVIFSFLFILWQVTEEDLFSFGNNGKKERRFYLKIVLGLNPATVLITGIVVLLWKLSQKTTYTKCWKVIKKFFFLIHSQARIICMVDAGIGAFIASSDKSMGMLIVGMTCGALLGVLNYYVVSIWWLKLQPKF